MEPFMTRAHFRAALQNPALPDDALSAMLAADAPNAAGAVRAGRCLTLALYRHEGQLFLYAELPDPTLSPAALFPRLSAALALWPERQGPTPWAPMYHIYYHCIPESEAQWQAARHGKKARRGRIAYLKHDKLFSYTYHHQAIVQEGLLEGDQYQSIALHEDVLFSYFEEPKHFTHIKKEDSAPSRVIENWLAVDPESHFDHALTCSDSNFLMLPMVFSVGKEDFV